MKPKTLTELLNETIIMPALIPDIKEKIKQWLQIHLTYYQKEDNKWDYAEDVIKALLEEIQK